MTISKKSGCNCDGYNVVMAGFGTQQIEKYIRTKGLYIFNGTKIITNKATEIPTNNPLQIAPAKKADANSIGVKGGNNKSVILPATLALNKEEEVLPKAS